MKHIFLGSLVCNVGPGVKLLKMSSQGNDGDSAAPGGLWHTSATDLGSVACEGHEVRVSQKTDEHDGSTEHRFSWAGELCFLHCTTLSPGPRVSQKVDRRGGRTKQCLSSAGVTRCLMKCWLWGLALFAVHLPCVEKGLAEAVTEQPLSCAKGPCHAFWPLAWVSHDCLVAVC